MRTLIRKDVDGASGDVYFEQIAGLSTETKPTANLASGSEFFEVDTGKKFIFDETENSWIEAPSVADLKSAFDLFSVEETLLRDELPGTTTTVTLDGNGNPTSIVHSADGATVRTDTFVWSTNSVTETRETDEYYITITTNLTTLAQTISEIEEVA